MEHRHIRGEKKEEHENSLLSSAITRDKSAGRRREAMHYVP